MVPRMFVATVNDPPVKATDVSAEEPDDCRVMPVAENVDAAMGSTNVRLNIAESIFSEKEDMLGLVVSGVKFVT